MSRIVEYLKRDIERYSADVNEVDRVMQDHYAAEACAAFEYQLRKGLVLFRALIEADEHLREQAYADKFDYSAEVVQAFADLFRWWLSPKDQVLKWIEFFETRGHTVEGADKFRAACREAIGIATPDQDFFGGDKLVRLRDEALEANHLGECESVGS